MATPAPVKIVFFIIHTSLYKIKRFCASCASKAAYKRFNLAKRGICAPSASESEPAAYRSSGHMSKVITRYKLISPDILSQPAVPPLKQRRLLLLEVYCGKDKQICNHIENLPLIFRWKPPYRFPDSDPILSGDGCLLQNSLRIALARMAVLNPAVLFPAFFNFFDGWFVFKRHKDSGQMSVTDWDANTLGCNGWSGGRNNFPIL